MKTFIATLFCPDQGKITDRVKADSEQEARIAIQEKHPDCKIISIEMLLLG
jgi:hypothetical protein